MYPNNNTCDQSNGYGYNAKKLIEDKVQLALNENIGGIMIWAIDQDHSNPSNSLLNVIDAKLNGGSGGGSGGSCTPWSAGTPYYVGDIVTYTGSNYICVHDNPGYDPVISHWFWDPTSQNCSGGSGGGGACSEWSAVTQYYTGDIVSYNGSNYICEHDNPGYDPVISTWFWDPTSAGCRSAKLNTSYATKNMEVYVYPNPLSNTTLNLDIESNKGSQIDVKILDLQGRVIKRIDLGKLNTGRNNFKLDASDLRVGTYLIYIISDQGTKTKRFSVI
ncbi:carbohydrate-binding protein [Aquimarina celericrescens]|uniref:Carbohydrate-binding protein n=1 Tax=Aquimarina celericrescens TaxID=1964542 RepID=A0ABW5AT21_9FLAO|nr:T9SS type A sorting domain-containing protein [Aquimarina celericrescens]